MYSETLYIDGQELRLTQTVSGAGFRATITYPAKPPPGFPERSVAAAQRWCGNLMRNLRHTTARAWREGETIQIETLGDNFSVEQRLPELAATLERMLGRGDAQPLSAQAART